MKCYITSEHQYEHTFLLEELQLLDEALFFHVYAGHCLLRLQIEMRDKYFYFIPAQQ